MSYMKPSEDGRQYIYMDVNGRVIQSLPSEPGNPKIIYYVGNQQSINEAMALMAAMNDFLLSQGVKPSISRDWKFKKELRFNGKTWLTISNWLFDRREKVIG